MRFLLLGDIHCYGHYAFDAIRKLGAQASLDAVVCTGDLTNAGGQIELESVAGAVKSGLEAIGSSHTPFIACMGNHDYGNKVNSDEENALCRARFESVVGVPFRHVANIKGYTFITFSARNHSAGYTDDDYAWLDSQIYAAERQSTDAPVFVISHYSSGAAGLYGDPDGAKGGRLHSVLADHPRSVLLSGHSHAFLANERSFMQAESGYHSINSGSLWQSCKWDEIPGNVNGYYIPAVTVAECDGGRVTLTRYDIQKDAPLGRPWVITSGADNSLEARAKSVPLPSFEKGDIEVSNVGARALLISYPQATGEVEYYKAEANCQGEKTVTATFTSYYFMPRQGRGMMEIDGLEPNSQYSLTLYPVDFYGRVGEGIKGAFKTMPEDGFEGDVLYDGPVLAEMWSGDVQNIREEVGFATDSDEATPYIISKAEYELGGNFAVFAENSRNRYNNSDTDFSCLQVGRFTLATCRTKEGNVMALLENWQIDDGNPFLSQKVTERVELPYAIGKQTLGLTLSDGWLTAWRDSLPAIKIKAEGDDAPVAVALRLGETWGVFENCATFSQIKIAK